MSKQAEKIQDAVYAFLKHEHTEHRELFHANLIEVVDEVKRKRDQQPQPKAAT
jgi:hypothetical protein